MNYFYIFGTVLFTIFGQIVLKWRMDLYGQAPEGLIGKVTFLVELLLDPFIIMGLFFAFLAATSWLLALTKFSLSYAYPFIGLTYVMVLASSVLIFKEPCDIYKLVGVGLIIVGIFVSSRAVN